MVSLDMTVSVVEPFEIVEIKKQKGQRLSVAIRPIGLHFELMIKMPGIVKLGEVIDNTEFTVSFFAFAQQGLHLFLLGDVDERPAGADKYAVFYPGFCAGPYPSKITGFVFDPVVQWLFYTAAEFQKSLQQKVPIVRMVKFNKVLPNDIFLIVSPDILSNRAEIKYHPLMINIKAVSYTHLRAHETRHDLVCRLLLEK